MADWRGQGQQSRQDGQDGQQGRQDDQGPNGVEALRRSIDDLAEVVENAAPRDEVRRNVTALLILVGVMAIALLITGSIARNAATDQIARDVTTCFISPGRVEPATARACDTRFPGYAEQQKRSVRNTRRFEELLRNAARDNERLADLEARVKRIETGRP